MTTFSLGIRPDGAGWAPLAAPFRNYEDRWADVQIAFRAGAPKIEGMSDFLAIVGIVVFAVLMLGLISALDRV
jgi:hypothetical protein